MYAHAHTHSPNGKQKKVLTTFTVAALSLEFAEIILTNFYWAEQVFFYCQWTTFLITNMFEYPELHKEKILKKLVRKNRNFENQKLVFVGSTV